MATIQASLQIYDQMSAPLMAINNALNVVENSFENLKSASSRAMDSFSIQNTQVQLAITNIQLNEIGNDISNNAQEQENFNETVKEGGSAAEGLGGKIKSLVGQYVNLENVKKAISFISDATGAYDVQVEAETKLADIMKTRMNANSEMIDSVKRLASEQQQVGVIGDEVQLVGAQQLSTYLNSTEALNSLIPAMNSLAVQQNGLGASQDDLVNIGNVMGQVMQGETDALTRVGLTFTEAQEKVLKYGNEQERAAMLSQVITDNVGNMNETIANTPQGQIQQMNNNWNSIIEVVGQRLSPAVMSFFEILNENMPMAESIMMIFADALFVIINVVSNIIDVIGQVGSIIGDNWSIIEPIVLGIVGALGLYVGILALYNIVQGISNGIKAIAAIREGIHTAFLGTQTAATFLATAAQQGLNTALLACPLTWIVIAIIAIIVAIYAVVGAINKITGSSISATGIICGVLFTAGAFIGNLFVTLINTVVDIFVILWNFIASFANFFANVFNDPVGAAARLFFDLVDTVLSLLQTLASGIDTIFGSHLADSVQGWRDSLTGWVDDTFGKGIEVVSKIDGKDMHIGRFEYDEAYNSGYKFGKGIDDKISAFNVNDLFNNNDMVKNNMENFDRQGILDSTGSANNLENLAGGGLSNSANSIDRIADNTSAIKNSVSTSEEDLKYLRQIAEKDAVNRFTTAEIKIDMTNNNSINTDSDIDGIVSQLSDKLYQQMIIAKEGV